MKLTLFWPCSNVEYFSGSVIFTSSVDVISTKVLSPIIVQVILEAEVNVRDRMRIVRILYVILNCIIIYFVIGNYPMNDCFFMSMFHNFSE